MTLDRRFELSRKAARPVETQAWHEAPNAIQTWERDLAQWEHVSGNTMDSITKIQTLCNLLPSDLQERITSQLSANSMTYSTMREFALAQVARKVREPTKKKATEAVPADLDLAECHEEREDEEDDNDEGGMNEEIPEIRAEITAEISDIINKIRSIVKLFRRSPTKNDQLQKYCINITLRYLTM